VRVLFVMRHAGYVRNFEWVLRTFAERSHQVHIGFERDTGDPSLPNRLETETGGAITHSVLPSRDDPWRVPVFGIRQSLSYLRYLSALYRDAAKLRERWARVTPRMTVRLLRSGIGRSAFGRALVARGLRAAERIAPRPRTIETYLRAERYDVVLATPLVDGPSQTDWIRAAQAQGTPAVLAVASWDNLTNKGVMFVRPDRTYVWNEIQRREAIELHGLAPDSVVAVGAHSFDHWFDWRPTTSRTEFCEQVGLDPARPFVLYVCSSDFISRDERPLVEAWVEGLRADSELRDLGVLVRPHPINGAIWAEHSLGRLGGVAVWPPAGADPTDAARRSAYFDSLYHCAAVVGANTTALIDAAIVGRRTFSVLFPELQGAQGGTLHFHYLLPEEGGVLTVASSLEEHVAQLRACLADPPAAGWQDAFLRRFVRPFGLAEPAASRLVTDIEQLAAR
jgi:hypothetical protein